MILDITINYLVFQKLYNFCDIFSFCLAVGNGEYKAKESQVWTFAQF